MPHLFSPGKSLKCRPAVSLTLLLSSPLKSFVIWLELLLISCLCVWVGSHFRTRGALWNQIKVPSSSSPCFVSGCIIQPHHWPAHMSHYSMETMNCIALGWKQQQEMDRIAVHQNHVFISSFSWILLRMQFLKNNLCLTQPWPGRFPPPLKLQIQFLCVRDLNHIPKAQRVPSNPKDIGWLQSWVVMISQAAPPDLSMGSMLHIRLWGDSLLLDCNGTNLHCLNLLCATLKFEQPTQTCSPAIVFLWCGPEHRLLFRIDHRVCWCSELAIAFFFQVPVFLWCKRGLSTVHGLMSLKLVFLFWFSAGLSVILSPSLG